MSQQKPEEVLSLRQLSLRLSANTMSRIRLEADKAGTSLEAEIEKTLQFIYDGIVPEEFTDVEDN